MSGFLHRRQAPRVVGRVAVACAAAGLVTAGWATSAIARQHDATTFCVLAPTCTGTREPDLQAALDAANRDAGTNIVDLGAGSFGSAGIAFSDYPGDPVRIVGVGNGLDRGVETVLTAPVELDDPGSSVENLAIETSSSGEGPALVLAGGAATGQGAVANRVSVTSTAAGGAVGVDLEPGARIAYSSVVLPSTPAAQSIGIEGDGSGDSASVAYVDDLVVRADTGMVLQGASMGVRATEIFAATGIWTSRERLQLDDDLIEVDAPAVSAAVVATGVTAVSDALVTGRSLTVVGASTDDGADGVGVAAFAGPGASTRVDLEDSIVWDLAHSFYAAGGGSAAVHAGWSDFAPTIVDGGHGDFLESAPNASVDPRFVDAAAHVYTLTASSPLIDVGRPGALEPDEPSVDLRGSVRLADGNRDGRARRDIGAFEYRPRGHAIVGAPATKTLAGGKGNDWLYAGRAHHVRVLGGAGDDHLFAGRSGSRLLGGPGNDTLYAADGVRDFVDCGPGRDVAYVDRSDSIRACERTIVLLGPPHANPPAAQATLPVMLQPPTVVPPPPPRPPPGTG